MRRSKEVTAETRKTIVATASRLFREKGFDGIGIADIMATAGLTHGGFYRHFASKEALIAEAMTEAFEDHTKQLKSEDDGDIESVRSYVSRYLSAAHVTKVSQGCPIAAVGSECQHLGPVATGVFFKGIESLLKPLTNVLRHSSKDGRKAALRLLSSLVGAVVLARASNNTKLQAEILDAVRDIEDVANVLRRTRGSRAKPKG
jgi:TetR/AcrR family transcriptional regulator, transcriptional repressor for nem operon